MKKICAFILLLASNVAFASDGLISLESNYSVEETANRLEAILKEKGFTIFNRVNHSSGAASVGLELAPTEVLIFGNPKVGTLLMQCSKGIAIDLPQKALFWQDDNGKVWLSYNNPESLKQRYDVKGCDAVFEKVSGVLAKLSQAAVK